MIKDIAIRNYWESFGSFDHIGSDMGKSFEKIPEDSLYVSLGFIPMKGHTAKELFRWRKMCLQHSLNHALAEASMEKDEFLDLMEQTFGPLFIAETTSESVMQMSSYVEILSSYILNDLLVQQNYDESLMAIVKQMEKLIVESRKVYKANGYVIPEGVSECVKALINKIVVKSKVVPKVIDGVFYIPKPLGKREEKTLISAVARNVVFGVSEISSDIFLNCMKDLLTYNYTDLLDVNIDRLSYTVIFDLSLKMGCTVADTLSKLGINHVEYWEQYKKHKCIYFVKETTDVVVARCDVNGEFTVTKEIFTKMFMDLYRQDTLYDYLLEGVV